MTLVRTIISIKVFSEKKSPEDIGLVSKVMKCWYRCFHLFFKEFQVFSHFKLLQAFSKKISVFLNTIKTMN